MLKKFEQLKKEFKDLEKKLILPEVISNNEKLKEYSRRHGELSGPVRKYNEYLKFIDQFEQAKNLFEHEEGELKELAQEEMDNLSKEIEQLEKLLKTYLIPKDPDIEKDIIIEIRAGTGGEEAALFCAKLFRMYSLCRDQKLENRYI